MIDTSQLHTRQSLARAFREAGLEAGMDVLMHSRMGAIGGMIMNGAEAAVYALMDVITPSGTLMMPTHTSNNSNPQYWKNPSVPAEWWQRIREESVPYHPITSQTRMMGAIVEVFRTFPNVVRSSHPLGSFTAWGKFAHFVTQKHSLDNMFGQDSPLARLESLGGNVFLLGVTHANSTLLHLAEHRAKFSKVYITEESAVLVDGKREWVSYNMIDYDDEDFEKIGVAYETGNHPLVKGRVGNAETRLVPARPLLDFATFWMSENRT